MIVEGRGGQVSVNDGGVAALRLGATGAAVTSNGVGLNYENVRNGNVYWASMQAGAALGTALTATAVTMTLYNPQGSGVNASLLHTSLAITSAPVGSASYVYAVSNNPQAAAPATVTSAVGWGNALMSTTRGRVQAYTAATLPAAPVIARVLGSILATGSTATLNFNDYVDGALVLQPGTCVTIQGLTTASSGIVAMTWEEVPV